MNLDSSSEDWVTTVLLRARISLSKVRGEHSNVIVNIRNINTIVVIFTTHTTYCTANKDFLMKQKQEKQ